MSARRIIHTRWLALFLFLATVGLIGAGCAENEPDNVAERPWNSPEGWQNGNLPSQLTQPH